MASPKEAMTRREKGVGKKTCGDSISYLLKSKCVNSLSICQIAVLFHFWVFFKQFENFLIKWSYNRIFWLANRASSLQKSAFTFSSVLLLDESERKNTIDKIEVNITAFNFCLDLESFVTIFLFTKLSLKCHDIQ